MCAPAPRRFIIIHSQRARSFNWERKGSGPTLHSSCFRSPHGEATRILDNVASYEPDFMAFILFFFKDAEEFIYNLFCFFSTASRRLHVKKASCGTQRLEEEERLPNWPSVSLKSILFVEPGITYHRASASATDCVTSPVFRPPTQN